jgi:hypothetical protein
MTVQNVSINAERAKRILFNNMGYTRIIQNAAKGVNIFHIAAIFMRLFFSRPPVFKVRSDSRNLVYRYNRIPRWNRGKRRISNKGAKILQKYTSLIKILVAF